MGHLKERIEHLKLLQKLKVGNEKPGWTILRAMRLADAIRSGDREAMVIDGLNGLKARFPHDLAFANVGFALNVVRAVLDGALGPITERKCSICDANAPDHHVP